MLKPVLSHSLNKGIFCNLQLHITKFHFFKLTINKLLKSTKNFIIQFDYILIHLMNSQNKLY